MEKNLDGTEPQQLIPVVKNENLSDVSNLIRKLEGYVEEKKCGSDGYTPLHIIVAKVGNAELLKLLVNNVDIKDKKDLTALHYVLTRRNLKEAKILIDAGANVNSRDDYGETALHVSVENSDIEMINYLLPKGANVNITGEWYDQTPLHKAALHCDGENNSSIFEILLKNGADVNIQDKNGCTPLHYLVPKASNIKAIELLLSHKADVNLRNISGETPLFKAVRKGHVENLQLLVKNGASVKVKNGNGSTPLHQVAWNHNGENHLKIAEILLKNGADINVQNNDVCVKTAGLKTPLHSFRLEMEAKMVQIFLKYKPNLALKDSEGNTPLFKAVSYFCDDKIVQLLIDHGADVKSVNTQNGLTPLHYASYWASNIKVLKILLNHGADMNALDHKGRTPFLYTLKCSLHCEIEKENLMFSLKYSDFNIIDEKGNNILNYLDKTDEVTETVFEILLNHLAVLPALNFSLHPSIIKTISDEDTFTDYFEKCKEELVEAKKTKLPNSWVTFFNLLTDNKKKLKNYAGNTDLVKAFQKSNWAVKFPIYGASMQEKVKKGIKRREVFDKSSIIFSQHLPIFKPNHLIVRDVFDCVSTKELTKFCEKNSKRMHDRH